MFKKAKRIIKTILLEQKHWKQIEYFNESWKDRIKKMAQAIPNDTNSIMDLGCGRMWLKEYLDENIKYYGADYVNRGEGTIIADFNKKQYPSINVDISFISGCLEYVKHTNWFIEQVSIHSKRCVVSYCTIERFPNISERKKLAWINHFSNADIIEMFERVGLILIKLELIESGYTIYEFTNEKRN